MSKRIKRFEVREWKPAPLSWKDVPEDVPWVWQSFYTDALVIFVRRGDRLLNCFKDGSAGRDHRGVGADIPLRPLDGPAPEPVRQWERWEDVPVGVEVQDEGWASCTRVRIDDEHRIAVYPDKITLYPNPDPPSAEAFTATGRFIEVELEDA